MSDEIDKAIDDVTALSGRMTRLISGQRAAIAGTALALAMAHVLASATPNDRDRLFAQHVRALAAMLDDANGGGSDGVGA